MIRRLFELPRKDKKILMLLADIVTISACFYTAFALRLASWSTPLDRSFPLAGVWFLMLLTTLAALWRTGQYRTIVHFMTAQTINELCLCAGISALSIYLFSALLGAHVPRTVPIIHLMLLAVVYGGIRLIVCNLYMFHSLRARIIPQVVVYGAGRAGTELVAALQLSNKFHVVAFIDDDPKKQHTIRHGIPVHPFASLPGIIGHHHVAKILLAIPRIHHSERRRLLDRLAPFHLEVLTVPSPIDNISGTVPAATELADVSVEDILGRDPIPPIEDLLFRTTCGKSVLVTGAGGSIGSELCRQIATHRPRRLVLYEMSELALYLVTQELCRLAHDIEIIPCLGDVKNRDDIEDKLRTYGVQTVYHAAAYKHVPMVELNVIAGIRNNVFGTLHAAQAALAAGTERLVLISTDKAVRPTNIMGASKRVAELVLQAYAREQTGTCFSMVRFGNVLGSSGSVFPLFRRQIAAGGPVTVTHPEVTRFFMTIPEAVQLVLQASGMARGGEVFVLDMGAPVKILDMAKEMIRLSGRTPKDADHPDGDIEIRITGLRPGEKLYEELLVTPDTMPTAHPRIMSQKETSLPLDHVLHCLDRLDAACTARDIPAIIRLLQHPATAYSPLGESSDLVWNAGHSSITSARFLAGEALHV